jgi:integrase
MPRTPTTFLKACARLECRKQGRKRDVALFNLAIDSKLRGCDVVAVRVEDVASNGYALDRATVRGRKTGLPVRFELTDQTRQAVDEYLHQTARSLVSSYSLAEILRAV